MKELKRHILKDKKRDETVSNLQSCLYDLIDLALQGKQAHWNIVGSQFRSVHLQLDEIIATTRDGSDEVAERIATLGIASDGSPKGVADNSRLEPYPTGLQSVEATVTAYSDRLAKTIDGLRESISVLGEIDPVSEDLLIGLSGQLEKHLWMMQAQEV